MLTHADRVNLFDKLTREGSSYLNDLASIFEAPIEIKPDYFADWCALKQRLVAELDQVEVKLFNNIQN